jgi:hypothetical protein
MTSTAKADDSESECPLIFFARHETPSGLPRLVVCHDLKFIVGLRLQVSISDLSADQLDVTDEDALAVSKSVDHEVHVCAPHKRPRLLIRYITRCVAWRTAWRAEGTQVIMVGFVEDGRSKISLHFFLCLRAFLFMDEFENAGNIRNPSIRSQGWANLTPFSFFLRCNIYESCTFSVVDEWK